MISLGILSVICLRLLMSTYELPGVSTAATEMTTNRNHLTFDSIVNDNNNLKYLITLSQSATIDASATNQILVQNYRNLNSKNVNIILFHCRVKPLTNHSKISTAEICYKPTLKSNELCHNIMNTDVIEMGPALSIRIDWNPLTGFSADFSIKSNLRSNDGLYYCKLGNRHHSIVSNYIELENVAYQFTNQLNHIIPVEQFQPMKITDFSPVSLHCGRNSYPQPESTGRAIFTKSPFYWMFWEKLMNEQKPLSAVNDMMEYVQHQNGTLQIFRFQKMRASLTLMCNNELSQTYYSIYALDIDIRMDAAQYNSRINTASPMHSQVVLREGPVGLKKESLSAVYYSNPLPTMTKAAWKRNNVLLTHIYPESLSNNYNFLFPKFIDYKYSGQYDLHVDQIQPADHAMFTFDVDVITVPKFKGKPSEMLYKIAGQSAELLVELSGNIGSSSVEIYIDNVLVPLIASDQIANSTDGLVGYIKPIDQQNLEARLSMNRLTNNLTELDNRHKQIDHSDRFSRIYTVTFVSTSRNLTSSRMSHLVQVFSFPELSAGIRLDDCPTAAGDHYNLSYVTNADQYVNAGLQVDHLWTLTNADNQLISSDLDDYVTIRNTTAYLSRDIAKVAAGLQLRYRMQIFHQSSTDPTRILIFDSNDHHELVRLFHTRITCVTLSEFPIAVVAIIIAIIVAILIVLTFVLCLTKKKGETYNIDKNERAMGHDPEAECRENETFLNYERQNDDLPTKASRMSLDNYSVGETTEEGGELDDGGIDTDSFASLSKFDVLGNEFKRLRSYGVPLENGECRLRANDKTKRGGLQDINQPELLLTGNEKRASGSWDNSISPTKSLFPGHFQLEFFNGRLEKDSTRKPSNYFAK